MEEKITKRLPLGSIVILNGGVQKLMIISRAMLIPIQNKQYLFEYGGCVYPQGLVSDRVFYFNTEDISEVVFEGFSDEDDVRMNKNIDKWTEDKGFEKGTVKMLKNKGQA